MVRGFGKGLRLTVLTVSSLGDLDARDCRIMFPDSESLLNAHVRP